MARRARNRPVPRDSLQEIKVRKQTANAGRQIFNTALYIRLSKEDGGKNSQNTVENQRALLEEFVRNKQDIRVFDTYIDNGFTGTNFERPAFRKMMEDAENGNINCIIVKDLSRFGRSYLETGNYLEKLFPSLKIRFISVTDHFDTCEAGAAYGAQDADRADAACVAHDAYSVHAARIAQDANRADVSYATQDSFRTDFSENTGRLSNGIEIPLKNIINEVYAKDISRKICSAIEIKKQEGRYSGGLAPYGYQKSKTVKGKYEVDKEAAEVVRYIFELRSKGHGYDDIVKILKERGIKSPGAYRYEKGMVKNERMRDAVWRVCTIKNMLRDEVYLGSMVRGKTLSAMYKGEKRHHVPRSEWIIVQGTHEPVISREIFDAAQAISAAVSNDLA